jgi:hypothetical protein
MSEVQRIKLLSRLSEKPRRGAYRHVRGGIQINDRAAEMRIYLLARQTDEPVEMAIERAVDERLARIRGRRPRCSSKRRLKPGARRSA